MITILDGGMGGEIQKRLEQDTHLVVVAAAVLRRPEL